MPLPHGRGIGIVYFLYYSYIESIVYLFTIIVEQSITPSSNQFIPIYSPPLAGGVGGGALLIDDLQLLADTLLVDGLKDGGNALW